MSKFGCVFWTGSGKGKKCSIRWESDGVSFMGRERNHPHWLSWKGESHTFWTDWRQLLRRNVLKWPRKRCCLEIHLFSKLKTFWLDKNLCARKKPSRQSTVISRALKKITLRKELGTWRNVGPSALNFDGIMSKNNTEKNIWSNFTQLCRLNLGHKDIWTPIKS